jgi:hypothetical protein
MNVLSESETRKELLLPLTTFGKWAIPVRVAHVLRSSMITEIISVVALLVALKNMVIVTLRYGT